MSNPNTLDYSNLESSLKTTRSSVDMTKRVAKEIWDLFLTKNPNRSKKLNRQQSHLNDLSSNIEWASEALKVRFNITVNALITKWLLKTDNIKSIKLNGLKTPDEKLQSIMNTLISTLSDSEKSTLNDEISKGMTEYYQKLEDGQKLTDERNSLKKENEELKADVEASEAVNDIVEQALLDRWNLNKYRLLGRSIQKAKEKAATPLEASKKIIRKISRSMWANRTKDVNGQYTAAAKKIAEKISTWKNDEKVLMRFAMKELNKAYDTYLKETTISKDTRNENLKRVNKLMAAA